MDRNTQLQCEEDQIADLQREKQRLLQHLQASPSSGTTRQNSKEKGTRRLKPVRMEPGIGGLVYSV